MAKLIYVSDEDSAFLGEEAERDGTSKVEVLAKAISVFRDLQQLETRLTLATRATKGKIELKARPEDMGPDELDRWPKLRKED